MRAKRLRTAMLAVGVVAAAVCALAIPARATYGARTTADEPQYLTSALSLWDDHDLDIHDELQARRWRDYHEARLPRQTQPLADGRELSPHDPLLPVMLAAPMGLGGWALAKATLAVLAGLLAALLVWTAVRRFGVPVRLAAAVVLGFAITSPFVVYGTQVYPELPAALAVAVAIAGLTGKPDRRSIAVWTIAVVALPWLAIKYALVAAALAVVGLVRLVRTGSTRRALAAAGAIALAGIAFLAFHKATYGGWTSYASGDEFSGGEFTVVGRHPNYLGRSARLIGLVVDRDFGLAAWAPAYLLAIPALAALLRRRPPGWAALALPLAAGWVVATWIALTLQGWWWPGRQVVVVLPAVVLATAWWLAALAPQARRRLAGGFVALTAFGVVTWAWVLTEVLTLRRRLIIDFFDTANPLYQGWRAVLPDEGDLTGVSAVLFVLWIVAAAALARAGWCSTVLPNQLRRSHEESADRPAADAGAGVDHGRVRRRRRQLDPVG